MNKHDVINKAERNLSSRFFTNWLPVMIFTRHCYLRLMILGVVLLTFLGACRGRGGYDSDKQYAFLVKFTAGMTKEEVDAVLLEHQDITLLEEFQERDEFVVRYSAPIEIYGSNIFTFRYSAEMKLIYVIPVELLD